MRFLSGLQDETVVGSQRKRIGGEFIQLRLPEANRRLHVPRSLVLAQNVGDVIGAESAGGMCSDFGLDEAREGMIRATETIAIQNPRIGHQLLRVARNYATHVRCDNLRSSPNCLTFVLA